MIFWGNNQIEFMGGFVREEMRSALLGGAKLIVIDPKKIDIAKRSNIWIAPRPSTDGILALGMIKYVIENKLYDEDFVQKWTIGFDDLKNEVTKFSYEDVERITWVKKDAIAKAVRMMIENKPVCLVACDIHITGDTGRPQYNGGKCSTDAGEFYKTGSFLCAEGFAADGQDQGKESSGQ
jgi:anaerobic selenocysteine-containing dehydrogenase